MTPGAARSRGAPPQPESDLLAADEPGPFEVVNPGGGARAVLVCDHASNRVPRALGDLGLGAGERARHIAWDPGAAEVARGLSARLDAPLILGGWSRLVIDLNRPLASPELIPGRSDGVAVSGNLDLAPSERARRLAALFYPYHGAVAALLDTRSATSTLLISIHSFTPILGGQVRPWHAGVACGPDRRLATPVVAALSRDPSLCIGDNRPYDVDHSHDYTLPTHGEARGIPNAMIEIRQDGVADRAGVEAWIDRLARAYAEVVGTGFGPAG